MKMSEMVEYIEPMRADLDDDYRVTIHPRRTFTKVKTEARK